MALYEIVNEITQRQLIKTEMGDNRMIGVLTGIVVKNYEKEMPGKICVRIPVRDKEADELKWARVMSGSGGTSWGHYFLPEIGDQVLLAFEQGNFEKPYVIGCIPKDNAQFIKQATDEKNKYKKIMTRNGTHITFADDGQIDADGKNSGDGDPGEKDKLTIQTALKTYTLTMDNEKKEVSLTDKEGKNKIVLATEDGKEKLSIVLAKKVELKVGEGVTITMDGESGSINIKAKKYQLETDSGVNVKSNGSTKLGGSNIILEADSTLKASSSGVVQISGSPIKIG